MKRRSSRHSDAAMTASRKMHAMEGEIVAVWFKKPHRRPCDPVTEPELGAGRGLLGNATKGGGRCVWVFGSVAWVGGALCWVFCSCWAGGPVWGRPRQPALGTGYRYWALATGHWALGTRH